jgi:hypothetical protein
MWGNVHLLHWHICTGQVPAHFNPKPESGGAHHVMSMNLDPALTCARYGQGDFGDPGKKKEGGRDSVL